MFHSSCLLKVGVVGLNHKTADLDLREGVARGAAALAGEKSLFFPHPTVLLSTCNRTEIYFSAEDLALAHTELLSFLRSGIGVPFEHCLYSYFHAECFAHLSRVTAGLDSAILAETDIQRQVKVAYAQAARYLALPPSIHYVFQKGLKIGKEVRQHLELERNAPTLYSTLYLLAKSFWENLHEKKILLVGYSKIQRGLISFLKQKKITQFALVSRFPVSLEQGSVHGREFLEHWREFDLICTASQSSEPLIWGKSDKKHLIFDLSVPRNVDPEVGKNPHVQLMNIEQIDQMIEERRKLQGDCLAECEALLWHHVARLSRIFRLKSERILVQRVSTK